MEEWPAVDRLVAMLQVGGWKVENGLGHRGVGDKEVGRGKVDLNR